MSKIAVIGMGCHYPGASEIRQLWENILAKRCQFRQLPERRLPLSDYYDPDPQAPDKTYGSRAAVIDGFEFDWVDKRIPKTAVESTDIVHWLALEVALKALEDAGYNREGVANERSGVVLGNTLTGEQTRSNTMRLRWPYVRRALRAAAKVKGLPPQAVGELVETMEEFYKSAFSPITEDTLAGGLSNTIAGRICNFLNFHGGGYTVDGACSSSLIAVATAATALTNGDLDLALAGGVDVSLDTFEMVGFAKTGALTSQDMTVYDRKASGFLPGEGCGFVVLKRLEDARADGDYVYAVLHGWGISSDGKGGITAPSSMGQAEALRRAYDRAGYSPHELDFIEGHGTGTPVGDRTELEGIALAISADGELEPRSVGVTSFKSLVGHTKAAAGVGGFIKAVMAVNQRVLPSTANCKDPNPVFENFAQSLYPILQGEVRSQTQKLRAGVSAMGFGGINCHVTIESGDAPSHHLKPSIEESALLVSNQETELFVLGAASVPALLQRTQTVMGMAAGMSVAEIVDLAAQLSNELESQLSVRAAVIASTPDELIERLQRLEEMLNDTPPATGEVASPQKEIWLGNTVKRSRVGFLFPGQGSQKLNMVRTLVERYGWARELLNQAAQWLRELGVEPVSEFIYRPLDRAVSGEQVQEWSKLLARAEVAQPAICLASLFWNRYLERLGIKPVVVGGHSLGELTAFQAAGAFDEKALLCLAAIRGQAMSASDDNAGIMASLSCSQETAEKLLQQVNGYVVVANINSPQQTVISGERSSVEETIKLAATQNIQALQLPVSNAFHSQMVSKTAEHLRREAQIPEELTKTVIQLFSSVKDQLVQSGMNLREHFANQVTAQVDFISLVKALAPKCDLMVEVGPGRVLSGLANAITEPNGPLCFPLESKPGLDRELNIFLGSFFVHGGEVNWKALYENRLVRPFIPASQRIFIENPCERPFSVSAAEGSPSLTISWGSLVTHNSNGKADVVTAAAQKCDVADDIDQKSVNLSKLLFELVEKRTGFPQATLSMDLRLLDDLNLDSIKAADLVATAAKQIGRAGDLDPSTLANASLADVVAALQEGQPASQTNHKCVSSVPAPPKASSQDSGQKLEETSNWVRNFAVEYVPQEAPQRKEEDWSKAKVLIVTDVVESPVAKALGEQILTQGARRVEKVTYEQISADESGLLADFSHYLAVLPQPTQSEQESLPLVQMVARLKSIATPPKADISTCVAYVQFGGGRFGDDVQAMPEVCCAAAFARSLHLERSDLRVRVVDLAQEIEPNRAAGLVMTELGGTASITTVGYDADLVRLVPQSYLQQPANYSKRSLTWSGQDVLLVTGGAKGITAECALALAQSTNVKMALVGRSPAPTDECSSEVARTLEQFRAKGLTCRYYSCDIANADAVAQLVETVTADLGAITGVIHGAGLNAPRRVEQVSLNAAQAEVSPKLLGAYNLLQTLASAPPKLFVAFSSIIGVTGMPGNAWYGFANESLDIMLRRFESAHPETSVLSLAYSVWGEVGMGARMGSVKNLARMGIGAISSEEGVGRFLKLFECDPGVKQVIIAACLGGLDTWSPVPLGPATGLRFIEQVLYVEPGVELKARTHLSLERDLYVQDHIWRGSYLFPTVFGLEAMAQATAYVTGEVQPQIVRIEDISLKRPVVVDPTTGVEIEVHAEVMEADAAGERRVKVGIRTAQTGFTTDHFTATFVLGELKLGVKTVPKLGRALDLDPQTELYGDLLFQGLRFQRIDSIFSLTPESSVFRSYVRPEADLLEESFAPSQGNFVLGDPYFRDVLLQSLQLTIPRDICLPVHIDKLELFRPNSDAGSRLVIVLLQKREGREYVSEVVATDEQGYVVECLTGYRLRILEEHPENPTAVELAFPEERDRSHLHEVLTTIFKAFDLNQPAVALGYAPNLQAKSKKQRLQQELPIIARALQTKQGLPPETEIDFGIKTLSSGKPEFTGAGIGLDLSLSHCDRYCLCVVEETPQGCDIEAITHRTAEDWVALLSVRSSVVDELVRRGDTRDRAATRIWSALEAVRKAFNGTNPEFSVVAQQGEGVLLQTQTPAGNYLVVTVPIKLTRPPERMVAIVIPQPRQQTLPVAALSPAASTADRDSHRSRYTNDGPQGQPVYEQRFQASFKDSGSISRRVYFSQYFRWIGQIRELPMESIASQMLSDFLSGDWGMVTNAVSLRVLGEATSYDVIQARAWVGNVVDSSFDTYIEFCKVLPDNLERLAIAEVKATWVRLVSYGVPSPMPFPKYLEEYLLRFAAKQPATLDLKKTATLPLPLLPASLAQVDFGRVVYQTPVASNRYGKLLRSEVFQTTLEESNLVGNVYYGNYFIWQGRILDLFLYSVAPEYLRVSNPRGEMICLYTRMDYLREAMPFDKIRVLLYVQSVSECGAVFNFEFFREQPDGSQEKLHVGQQEVAWVIRLDDGTPVAANWSPEVMQALVEMPLAQAVT